MNCMMQEGLPHEQANVLIFINHKTSSNRHIKNVFCENMYIDWVIKTGCSRTYRYFRVSVLSRNLSENGRNC